MKKVYCIILFLCSIMICQTSVHAYEYGIEDYYFDVTVLENGDLYVKEAFSMNGEYNGMERDILYKNNNTKPFSQNKTSLEGSDIYNGSGITLKQIRAIPYHTINWDTVNTTGDAFEQIQTASPGTYGVYQVNQLYNGYQYKIFNPSYKNNMFYLEYIIHNMAIAHEDIAEIGWNIFSEGLNESIHNLLITIHIPGNKEILRAWAHGPLTGEIELIGTDTIQLSINGLSANTAIDTRFVYDKNILVNPIKTSGMNALDSIIEIETIKANEANLKREEARKQQEAYELKQRRIGYSILGSEVLWLLFLMIIIKNVYKKYDKEYSSLFKTKYFRDFPSDYSPSTVGYLMNKQIRDDDLSASILNLIYKKIITFEKIDKKDYQLTYHPEKEKLTENEKRLVKLVFNHQQTITLKEVKKRAKSNYESFLSDYNAWKQEALGEAKAENLFEQNFNVKLKASGYAVMGVILGGFGLLYNPLFSVIILLTGIISLLYFQSFYKRTEIGNEQYIKWKALKNFMKDFGTMDQKDLPDIVLWEKYLVYAVTLGVADKLQKTMELKIKELPPTSTYYNTNFALDFNDIMIVQHVIANSINNSIHTAYSAQSIANSSNSSGGGFGGGFSGGGGSFGGGGGGGRF